MTFDVIGLLIFLLAIVPGFVAQQSRSLLVPGSLRAKSVLEETGNYVFNNIVVHLILLGSFRLALAVLHSGTPVSLGAAIAKKQLPDWAWQHRYLVLFYYVVSLLFGCVLGALRGVAERDGRIGAWLADNRFLRPLLLRLGVRAFLEEAPVWYEALREKTRDERTFVQVRMKQNGGFYTGELKSYGIVSDSDPNKDFLLVNVAYKRQEGDAYVTLDTDGVLLNFADAESISFIKQTTT
jgi:Family of unknown function (DUF6338)